MLLFAFKVSKRLNTLKLVPRPPPHAQQLNGQQSDHGRRAHRCTRIHIPCPLLRTPQCILQDRMESRFPQQEWRSPPQVGIELVVQTSRTQHADHGRAQHSRHNEIGRYPPGNLLLVALFFSYHVEEFARSLLGGLDPSSACKPE